MNAINREGVSVQTLHARVEAKIEKELARCERHMTPAEWCEHREWIVAYVVAGAREWLRKMSRDGQL